MKSGPSVLDMARKSYGKQPYRLINHIGETIVLPPSYANTIRNEPRLNFGEALNYVSIRDRNVSCTCELNDNLGTTESVVCF